jgi:hypothetical protein
VVDDDGTCRPIQIDIGFGITSPGYPLNRHRFGTDACELEAALQLTPKGAGNPGLARTGQARKEAFNCHTIN